MKVFAASLVTILSGGSVIAAQSSGALGVPASWIIGILVTILIAVLTAMGAIMKVAYDTSSKLGVTLYGTDAGDADEGFIVRSKERHDELQDAHEQVYEQLLVQGRLLSELAYSFADIAEELDDDEDLEINVNLDRIEELRERERDERLSDNDAD
jgi:hypothetical protein